MCSFQFCRSSICGSGIVRDKVNGTVILATKDLLSLIQLSVVRELDSGMGFYRVLNRCKAAVAGKKQTLPKTKSYGKLGAHGVYDGFLVNVVALPAVNPFGNGIEGILFVWPWNCDSIGYQCVCKDVFKDDLLGERIDIVINFCNPSSNGISCAALVVDSVQKFILIL